MQCARLFNCCPDYAAPDWRAFKSLRLGGCTQNHGYTQGLVSLDRAQFFTVYGIDRDGMGEAITDTDIGASFEEARALCQDVASLSGLPWSECAFLHEPRHTYTPTIDDGPAPDPDASLAARALMAVYVIAAAGALASLFLAGA